MAASITAFAESYNGLVKWAAQHRVTGVWAEIWPLQVDAFIAAGELTLLLSALYLWPMRVRVLAWTVSLTGLSVSIICNAGHVGSNASVSDHLTAALPPVAAIAGLVIALSVIKQITLMYPLPDRSAEPIAGAGAEISHRPQPEDPSGPGQAGQEADDFERPGWWEHHQSTDPGVSDPLLSRYEQLLGTE